MRIRSVQYAQFSPKERGRLALAANEREDLAEIDRLFRSCPEVTRILPDPTFTAPLMAMQAEVGRLLTQWVELSAMVILQGLAANGMLVRDVIEAGTANAAWRNMSALWRGIEAGIQGFCAEAGLTSDQLLALAGGRPQLVESAGRALHGTARADRECKKATWQRLSQAWEVGNQ